MKRILFQVQICLAIMILISCNNDNKSSENKKSGDVKTEAEREVWSKEKANTWYADQPWPVGADYTSSNAINQLEMWQAETFDSALIDKELGYGEGIGMNTMRVYLHHLAWQIDKEGFKNRMNTFLTIADKHHIKPLFVFFDDVWNDTYKEG